MPGLGEARATGASADDAVRSGLAERAAARRPCHPDRTGTHLTVRLCSVGRSG